MSCWVNVEPPNWDPPINILEQMDIIIIKWIFGVSHPVHAVVLPEALILNGDRRVNHILRDLFKVRPDPVFRGKKLPQLHIVPCFVLCQNESGLIELHTVKIKVGIGFNVPFQIGHSLGINPHGRNAACNAHKQGHCQNNGNKPPNQVHHAAGNRVLMRVWHRLAFHGLLLFQFHYEALHCGAAQQYPVLQLLRRRKCPK